MKEAPSSRPGRKSRAAILVPGVVVLLWGLAQLARDPTFFWCDDYQVQSLGFFEDIVRAWRTGEWPLLSLNSWCAGNLAGEFQLGTFSPPFNALLLILSFFPLTLAGKAAAISLAYLMWLAGGVFVLARSRGFSNPISTTAALATALSGWIVAWGATNWISFLIGFSWIPWAWWALETALSSGRVGPRWLRPACFVALLIVAGNTFAILMLPVIVLWLAWRALIRDRDGRALGPLAVAAILGTALSAPAWWLLMEAAADSPRWNWGMLVQRGWVVPWKAWLGLILPSTVTAWPNFSEQTAPHANLALASGLVPVAVLVNALLWRPREMWRQLRWELLLLVVCVVLASVPMVGQFRWSFRWLPLFQLTLSLFAASALRAGLAPQGALTAVILTGTAWAATAIFGGNSVPFLAVFLFGLTVVWWLIQRFAPLAVAVWSPAAVVALSLGAAFWVLPTHEAVTKYPFIDQLRDPAPLDPSRLYLSLYSMGENIRSREHAPGYGSILRPMGTGFYANLRMINGYSSFPGREVKALFGYFGEVQPAVAESLSWRDGERLLLFLGVDGILVSQEFAAYARNLGPEWEKITETPEGLVYHREPRRFVPVKTLGFVFDRPGVPLTQPALQIVAEKRNRVILEVTPDPNPTTPNPDLENTAPAIAPVAFVRPFMNGYRAFLNGAPVPVRAYRDIMPLVELPADARGTLELSYLPRGLTHGAALSAAAALVMILIAIFGRKRPVAI